jgi:hypothetical protein
VMASATEVLDAKNSLTARYAGAMQQALKDAKVNPVPQIPANLATPDDFTQWVQQNVPAAQQSDVSSRFNTLAVAASREAIQNSYAQANTLATLVAKSSFKALDFQWPWKRTWTWAGLAGVLASVGLLSLGAPFWFNMLKSLTNLRSVVAAKESAEAASPTL